MAGISMKFRQIDKVLRNNGFRKQRVKGDHIIYKRQAHETIVIPYVKCNELILEKYFKQFDIRYLHYVQCDVQCAYLEKGGMSYENLR